MKETLQPDRSRKFSHFATDIVLRAFAAHPDYCHREEIVRAGNLLKNSFFEADAYPDHRSANCWLAFQYPFWWSHLVSALDSLGRIGFDKADTDIKRGLDWFVDNQQEDGLWPTGYSSDEKNPNRQIVKFWVGLAICRMLRLY